MTSTTIVPHSLNDFSYEKAEDLPGFRYLCGNLVLPTDVFNAWMDREQAAYDSYVRAMEGNSLPLVHSVLYGELQGLSQIELNRVIADCHMLKG